VQGDQISGGHGTARNGVGFVFEEEGGDGGVFEKDAIGGAGGCGVGGEGEGAAVEGKGAGGGGRGKRRGVGAEGLVGAVFAGGLVLFFLLAFWHGFSSYVQER